jgi:hypothetical protein
MFFRSKKGNGKDAKQYLPAALESDKAETTPSSEASGRKGAPSIAGPEAGGAAAPNK